LMCADQLLNIGFSVDHGVPQCNSVNVVALVARHHRQGSAQTESNQTELRYIDSFAHFCHSRRDVFQPPADMTMAGIASRITASVKVKAQYMKSRLGETQSELAVRAVPGNVLMPHWIAKDYAATSPPSRERRLVTSEKARCRGAEIKRLDIHWCQAGQIPQAALRIGDPTFGLRSSIPSFSSARAP
jgi:hypothetical protein